MKKILLLKLSLLYIVFATGQIPQDNLVVHYPMDGDAAEITANQFNGEIVGNITPTINRNGEENKALLFDGETGYINVANHSELSIVDEITISVWIKPDSISPNGFTAIVNKWGADVNQDVGGYFLGINPNGNTPRWNTGSVSEDGVALPTGEWTHLVATYNIDTFQIYQNCELQVSVPGVDFILKNEDSLRIGLQSDPIFPLSQFFNGSIDDILIYNRVLSLTEIKQIFEVPTSLNEISPVTDFSVYPNPFNDQINIQNTSNTYNLDQPLNGEIVNAQGSILKKIQVIDENQTILTDDLPTGVYFLILRKEDGLERKKLIKH